MALKEKINILSRYSNSLYADDFLLTWEKSREDLELVLWLAEIVKDLRKENISPRCFDSGLAVSIFRDKSTRTRFSFASAANLLGLAVQDMDEEKSQISHGETVRETANMISFLADFIGIRDDMFLGEGNRYMREVSDALKEGFEKKVLPARPPVINLQCDLDHPTQSLADLLHLKNHFGSLENLRGKKIAMTWAYSPSYGKPLSVPQGIIALMTRFGMEVDLAYPDGYHLLPGITDMANKNAKESGGSFRIVNSMEEAFSGADIVYPKSWAPFSVMEKRTLFLKADDRPGLRLLENECLAENARHMGWECNGEMMKLTRNAAALYMHCLPADISQVSCKNGEVSKDVFERYRIQTYLEAGNKPYIIAAMMMASRFQEPGRLLRSFTETQKPRVRG